MDTGSRFVNELSDRAIRANAILALGKPALALADQTAVDKVGLGSKPGPGQKGGASF
jgi:hypothetical protein